MATVESLETPPATRESDADLLGRFIQSRDEAAFSTLVERHAELVAGVCRRVLGPNGDADDAFQATFMVLMRRAKSIRRRQALSSWLYGVAYRIAHRQRQQQFRRREIALMEPVVGHENTLEQLRIQHESAAAEAELQALPDSLRAPMVLRYLEAKSNQEVADELGISVAAVEGRLKRAKRCLRTALARRGVGLSIGLAALATLQKSVSAQAWDSLIAQTTQVCLAQGAGGAASTSAAKALTARQLAQQEILKMTMHSSSKFTACFVTAVAVGIVGIGLQDGYSQGEGSGGAAANQLSLDPFDGDAVTDEQATVTSAARAVSVAGSAAASTTGEETVDSELVESEDELFVEYQTATEKEIQKVLKEDTSIQFFDLPLVAAIEEISRDSGIKIMVDRKSLEDEGIDPQQAVTANMQGVSLRSALNHILRDLGLAYVTEDEWLLVTTQTEAENRLFTRIYPIPKSWNRQADEISKIIQTTVKPNMWDQVGGPASIGTYGDSLVINQTEQGHHKVVVFLRTLQELEEYRSAETSSKADAAGAAGIPGLSSIVIHDSERFWVQKIGEKLDSTTEFEFHDLPLEEVVDAISRKHDIQATLDLKALSDDGIDKQTPVTANVRGISLRSALRLMLRNLDLTYVIDNEILLITTPLEAESRLDTRIYPIPSTWGLDYQQLNNAIQKNVLPTSWDDVGGPAAMAPVGDGIAVSQTQEGHEELEQFLLQLYRLEQRGGLPAKNAEMKADSSPSQGGFGPGFGGRLSSGSGNSTEPNSDD